MNSPKREISVKSMSLIQKKFSLLLGEQIWVPDWLESKEREFQGEKTVLIMGSFFERIFQFSYWPNEPFYLFCLSQSVKEILHKLFLFDLDSIAIAPRYLLFPPTENVRGFPFTDTFTLVHAGRISPQKNIEFLILVTFYFQLLVSPRIKLTLLGQFDNEYHHDILNVYFGDYEKKILHLINSLPWPGDRPYINTTYNSHNWCGQFPENGLIISSSTLISEDFSVSIAQAQEKGFPCLLPTWGGFRDVYGDNIRFYSHEMIAPSHENLSHISTKAKNFVSIYIQKNLFASTLAPLSPQKIIYPKLIDKRYLANKKSENIFKWGCDIDYISDEKFFLFAKSETGKIFFKKYHSIFAGLDN